MKMSGRTTLRISVLFLIVCCVFAISISKKDEQDNNGSTIENTSTKTPYDQGISVDNDSTVVDKIDNIVNSMSLEKKVGQMFFCAKCNDAEVQKAIKEYNVGGILLYSNYFVNSDIDTVKKSTKNYQELSETPLFIGVDEEGGDVVRFSCFSQYMTDKNEKFLSPRDLYKGGLDDVKDDALKKCKVFKELGINVNFGPVCDISTKKDAYMYDRSLGQDTYKTSAYMESIVDNMTSQDIGVVLKHFPGFGNDKKNAGKSKMIVSSRTKKDYEEKELSVFRRGIDKGVHCIMMSHIVAKCFDENRPASLSKDVHDILRYNYKFNGVIITDSMDMEDIEEYTGGNTNNAVVKAILAGNDMIISAGNDYVSNIKAVIDAVNRKDIEMNLINDSVKRILLWKSARKLL